MNFWKASTTAILFTAIVMGCLAVVVVAMVGCQQYAEPQAVRESFTLYIQGPLVVGYDFVRDAGGEHVDPLFTVKSARIERSNDVGDVLLTLCGDGGVEWTANLDDSQRIWVLELSKEEPQQAEKQVRSLTEYATNEELNL